MAKKLYEEINMSALAEKIREKTGSSKTYKVSEMPSGVDEVYQSGYSTGHTFGYGEGFDVGLEEGRKNEYKLTYGFYLPGFSSSAKNNCVGDGLGDWIASNSGYSIYGFALGPCMQLKLSGAALICPKSNKSNSSIFFVTGYSEKGAGRGVVACDMVTVTPTNSTNGSMPPDEYVIDVPQGLGIDGVFFSCANGGVPDLISALGTFSEGYEEGYDSGHDTGYTEGQSAGYTEGHNTGYTEGHNKGYTEGREDGYAEGLEDGKAQGGGSGDGETEVGTDVSMSFGLSCGEKWYCPPNGENASSFNMMITDNSGKYTAFVNWSAVAGAKYKAIFRPMNSNNLWENILFCNSDYSTLTVIANDESLGQYVIKESDDTFVFTVPNGCSFIAINGYIQYGCKVYSLD